MNQASPNESTIGQMNQASLNESICNQTISFKEGNAQRGMLLTRLQTGSRYTKTKGIMTKLPSEKCYIR